MVTDRLDLTEVAMAADTDVGVAAMAITVTPMDDLAATVVMTTGMGVVMAAVTAAADIKPSILSLCDLILSFPR